MEILQRCLGLQDYEEYVEMYGEWLWNHASVSGGLGLAGRGVEGAERTAHNPLPQKIQRYNSPKP